MSKSPELQIDLRQMVIAIETAVSLVGMNDTNHGKRVGYIAGQLAHRLGFDKAKIQYAFNLGLLHDCGVSTEQMHSTIVNQFDWSDAHTHCEIGHGLLKDFEPLKRFAIPILYHHTRWDALKKLDLDPQDALMANLAFLSDRIDVLSLPHYNKDILLARKDVIHSIGGYTDSYFKPSLVSAFQDLADSEAFWISLEDRHITRYAWDMGQFEDNRMLTLPQLKQLSLIMAYIVDQKSPFTAQHSLHVAELARYIATTYGLSEEQSGKIEIAGLLHDLGKLHMPDHILEKPGPLSDLERSIMNQHSYETFEILRNITGLEEIAQWAAFHHENLNGAGYPFHPAERDLSIEARIVAVADVFQALVQDRPYRKGMQLDQVMEILEEFVDKGKLDGEIVDHARINRESCFKVARDGIGSVM